MYINPITTPLLGRYLNADFIQYLKDAIGIVNDNNAADVLHLDAPIAALQAALTPLSNLFVKERGSLMTNDIVLLNARRDEALTGIHMVVQGYNHYFDATMKEAARLLLAGMEKYGKDLTSKTFTTKTGIIDNLVKDIQQQPALLAAANTLGLYAWVNELLAANTAFDNKYMARTDEYANRPQGNIHDMREAVTDQYHELINFLTAYATINPQTMGYATIASQLNTLTKQYNENVHRRTGKSKPEADSDTPPSK